MQSGRLRERITIQQQQITRNEFGEEIVTWPTFATMWASVLPAASGERFITGAAQERAAVTHTVRIRYRAGITPKMRIDWDGRHLFVNTITDPTGRRAELVLMCEEEQLG